MMPTDAKISADGQESAEIFARSVGGARKGGQKRNSGQRAVARVWDNQRAATTIKTITD